ncbi:FtsK/SpoIIIE domain-containing protein [Nocardiopsis sp. NPDC006938]|uniref:FtsK/SpoIIIE domain-containing protein n=1 Tax=Nocardiopsis sp. NPDC006938 TaxID=3364337 RepID=UPI0036C361A4
MFLPSPSSASPHELRRLRADMERDQRRARASRSGPGFFAYSWRWLSGSPMDGMPRTDATWLRPATMSVDPVYRGRFYTRPRLARAGMRTGYSLVPPALGAGWWAHAPATYTLVALVAVLISVRAAWRMTIAILNSRHQRKLVEPLAKLLAPVLEVTEGTAIRGLEVPRTYLSDPESVIRLALPDTWRPDQVDQASKYIRVRLGGEWNRSITKTSPYFVRYTHKPAPPSYLSFSDVREYLEKGGHGTPLMGLGTEQTEIRLDFDQESPHVGMSVGTGGGKSSFFRLIIAQMAFHGVKHFTVIDPKMVSLQGMDDVIPGLKIYDEIEAEWAAISRFRAEMDRRYQILKANPNATFDRMVLILEEQNSFALESQLFWKEVKEKGDPATPPIWADIAFILLKARQVNMNVIAAYQRMDDKSTGSMGLRDQFGMKLLSRFSPSQWDMLVDTRPRALDSSINGRWVAVLNGIHRQVQVPYLSLSDVEEFMRPITHPPLSPRGVPSGVGAPLYEVTGGSGDAGDRGHRRPREQARILSTPPPHLIHGMPPEVSKKVHQQPVEERYTLKAACNDGIIPVKWDTAKRRRTRAGESFPKGQEGPGGMTYTKGQLCEFFGVSEFAEKDGTSL